MNKTMLVLCLSLVVFIGEAYVSSEKEKHRDYMASEVQIAILLEASPELYPQKWVLPANNYAVTETKLAGMSTAETKRKMVKKGLDEEAGRVDWKTAIVVLCVAFLVYLINRSKKQDMK